MRRQKLVPIKDNKVMNLRFDQIFKELNKCPTRFWSLKVMKEIENQKNQNFQKIRGN